MGKAAGIGLLGAAIVAYDHFSGRSKAPPAQPTPSAGPPPPPPGPPPAPAETPDQEMKQTEAQLLIGMMLAAANADGNIDQQETRFILSQMERTGMSPEERAFLEEGLQNPPRPDNLISQIQTPEMAARAYAVSLLAIQVDTDAEREYLADLGRKLGLSEEMVQKIEGQVGTL